MADAAVSLIWAMSENRVIGRDGGLPWRLPLDMRHFMDVTMGKPVVMGRKTFESMKSALPGRTNIVITRQADWHRQGVVVASDLKAAIQQAQQVCDRDQMAELMVIGGAQIYAAALPLAKRLYVTEVHADVAGDVYFPEFDLGGWHLLETRRHEADERHDYAFSIRCYER